MRVPEIIESSLNRYVNDGIRTGDFLRAVLANDLFLAVQRADPQNKILLSVIVDYIRVTLPEDSYGSYKKVDAWLKAKKERK